MDHPGAARLHPGEDHIAIITPSMCKSCHPDIKKLINEIGAMSSSVQGLNHVITTFSSFVNSDNKIYMLLSDDQKQALGFVKVGNKHLFFWDHSGSQREYNILCLLDFFVVPSTQRKGYGKKMIDKMLETEKKEMKEIPIDKPSPLCLSFMKKHFGLSHFTPQSNNYVVFDQFWGDDNEEEDEALKRTKCPSIYSRNRTPRLCTPNKKQPGSNNAFKQTLNPVYSKARTPSKRLNPITWLPY